MGLFKKKEKKYFILMIIDNDLYEAPWFEKRYAELSLEDALEALKEIKSKVQEQLVEFVNETESYFFNWGMVKEAYVRGY